MLEPVTVTLEEEEVASLRAMWSIVSQEPETSIMRLWFWHRLAELNLELLQAQIGQEETDDGRIEGTS